MEMIACSTVVFPVPCMPENNNVVAQDCLLRALHFGDLLLIRNKGYPLSM